VKARGEAEARSPARAEARRECYRERGIEPGPLAWFKALPDLAQAAVLGAAIAVPAVFIIVTLIRG
jgi:hypothetical protein